MRWWCPRAASSFPAAKTECRTVDLGRKFVPPKEGELPPQRCGRGERTKDGVVVRGSTMAEFCMALAHTPLRITERRKFVDKTGVAGRFDFDLRFPTDLAEGAQVDDLVRLEEALARVGLQLKSEKGQDEFIVIDHVERPTAN